MSARKESGFTLLEVLVAVAILGLGLTMILSSQVGLFSSAKRGENLTVATNLARCKMAETEVKLLKEGYPPADENDEGECCGEEGQPGFHCTWKIETVQLPEAQDVQADGGTNNNPAGGAALDPLMALSKLGQPGGLGSASPFGSAAAPSGPAALQDMADTVGAKAMSSGGLASMAMGMVYPRLKAMLEASIRKLTITVHWKEGTRDRDLTVTQYVTDPQQGNILQTSAALDALSGLIPGLGATGATGAGKAATPAGLGGLLAPLSGAR